MVQQEGRLCSNDQWVARLSDLVGIGTVGTAAEPSNAQEDWRAAAIHQRAKEIRVDVIPHSTVLLYGSLSMYIGNHCQAVANHAAFEDGWGYA